VDVHNDTDLPELVHWHGQMIPSDVDGAAEEGSPYVPAHGMSRISFMPRPAGFRIYQTHVVTGSDLGRGIYGGEVGPVYIEPKNDPGAYDREVFLALKEFEPSFSRGGDIATDALIGAVVPELRRRKGRRRGAAEGLRSQLRSLQHQRPHIGRGRANPRQGGRACPVSRA